MEIIKWINNNDILINLFSSIILAIATVFYVFLTTKLVSENIKIRRLQIDPKIVLDILMDENDPYFLNIIIENVGNGVALNLKFNVKSELNITKSKKISELGFIKNGLKTLSAKSKYKTMLIFIIDETNVEIFNRLIEIDIEYFDITGKKFIERTIIDLSYINDISYLRNKPEDKIIKEIKEITKTLKDISKNIIEIGTSPNTR